MKSNTDQKIKIRSATVNDLPTLLEFEQGIILSERPIDPTLKKGHIKYYDLKALILSDEAEVKVACIDDQIVGSGYAHILNAKPYLAHSQYAYLGFMFVKEKFRRKGVNNKILSELKAWAFEMNIHEVRLEVYEDNFGAVKSYEKSGFKKHIVVMRMEI